MRSWLTSAGSSIGSAYHNTGPARPSSAPSSSNSTPTVAASIPTSAAAIVVRPPNRMGMFGLSTASTAPIPKACAGTPVSIGHQPVRARWPTPAAYGRDQAQSEQQQSHADGHDGLGPRRDQRFEGGAQHEQRDDAEHAIDDGERCGERGRVRHWALGSQVQDPGGDRRRCDRKAHDEWQQLQQQRPHDDTVSRGGDPILPRCG
jgi:hypothetical protein